MTEVVDKDGLVCQKSDKPDDFADGQLEILGLHQLVAQVFQTAIATGDLFRCPCGQYQIVFLTTNGDGSSAFVIHKLPPYQAV